MSEHRYPLSNEQRRRAAKKVSHLVKEGMPQEQAVSSAMSMARSERLDEDGNYIPHRRS